MIVWLRANIEEKEILLLEVDQSLNWGTGIILTNSKVDPAAPAFKSTKRDDFSF